MGYKGEVDVSAEVRRFAVCRVPQRWGGKGSMRAPLNLSAVAAMLPLLPMLPLLHYNLTGPPATALTAQVLQMPPPPRPRYRPNVLPLPLL